MAENDALWKGILRPSLIHVAKNRNLNEAQPNLVEYGAASPFSFGDTNFGILASCGKQAWKQALILDSSMNWRTRVNPKTGKLW